MEAFNDTTYTCTYMISNIANLIEPFTPDASKKIKAMLSLPEYKWEVCNISGELKVNDIVLLYERIDETNMNK